MQTGKITQVIGAVVDVQFDGDLPRNSERAETDNNGKRWSSKLRSTLGEHSRAIAMDATEGLVRGQRCTDTAAQSRSRGQRHSGPDLERRR